MSGPGDELGVAIIGTIGKPDPDLERARRTAGGDLIKLFESLAGTSAPQALQEAVKRAGSGAFAAEDSDNLRTTDEEAPSTGETESARSNLCDITNIADPSGSDPFIYCFPNHTGTPSITRDADHMSCRIDSVNGPQRARYRYEKLGSWHTVKDIVLSSGQFMEVHSSYQWARRLRNCRTLENSNNRPHHFRIGGHVRLPGLFFSYGRAFFPAP